MTQDEKEDGGSAFPLPHFANEEGRSGMSLRDYFAAHAPVGYPAMWGEGQSSIAIEATRAYRWADAMIKARQQ